MPKSFICMSVAPPPAGRMNIMDAMDTLDRYSTAIGITASVAVMLWRFMCCIRYIEYCCACMCSYSALKQSTWQAAQEALQAEQ